MRRLTKDSFLEEEEEDDDNDEDGEVEVVVADVPVAELAESADKVGTPGMTFSGSKTAANSSRAARTTECWSRFFTSNGSCAVSLVSFLEESWESFIIGDFEDDVASDAEKNTLLENEEDGLEGALEGDFCC